MGKYKRKTNRKLTFTAELLEDVRKKLREGKSKRSIAEEIGVPEATLRKRLKEGSVPTSLGRFKPIFSQQMETELAEYCKELDRTFYGLTLKSLGSLVFEYAERNQLNHRFNKEKKSAGKDWVHAFCNRHQLSLRSAEKTSLARAAGFNRPQIELFFQNLKRIIDEKKVPPHRIFNMDESGILTVPNKLPKVVAPKGKRNVGKIVSSERGQLVTAVCCMGATGHFVPPSLIFPRKRQKPELTDGAPEGTLQMVSDSGFMNSELFLEWINHFQHFVKSSKEEPCLLILDNHSSHVNLNAILKCREHSIHLLSLPPHSSHRLQPLDRVFFGPLKTLYARECDNWQISHPGRQITQYQIGALFGRAYVKVACLEKAAKGFAACGIWPYNPDVFTEDDFAPASVTDRPLSETVQEKDESDDFSEPEDFQPLSTFKKKDKINIISVEIIRPKLQDRTASNLSSTVLQAEAGPSSSANPAYLTSPSGSQEPSRHSTPPPTYVSPKVIRPPPKASRLLTNRRKKMRSAVLTESPFKNELERKLALKTTKPKRQLDKTTNSLKGSKGTKSSQALKYFCPTCHEMYVDPPDRDWIQCKSCEKWYHEDCTTYSGFGEFNCVDCDT